MKDMMYLMDADSGFGIIYNIYVVVQEQTHGLFAMIFIPLIFISLWVLSRKVIVPATLFTAIGGPAMIIAPMAIKGPAMLMFIFGAGGLMYKWFKDR